jgi:hypothetical protein
MDCVEGTHANLLRGTEQEQKFARQLVSAATGRECERIYTSFNSLILQIDSLSEEEQRFMYVRGLKPNVKMEIVGSVGQLIKIAMLRVKNALPFLEC